MSRGLRVLAVCAVLIAAGVFVGSSLTQWRAAGEPAPGTGVLQVRVPRERVRVEVLNGGGREGMARAATDLLRDNGFDVVFYGNASSFGNDSSVVLDRAGRLDLAGAVADALGIAQVRSQPDSNLFLDVSVVLGGEWSREVAPQPENDGGWWDPRRWLGRERIELQGPIADPRPDGSE